MTRWLKVVLRIARAGLKSRRNLLLENLALRHQLLVLSRGSSRPPLTPLDRALWAWLSQSWDGWKTRLCLVQPSTVIQWHRAGFRLFWKWKSRPGKSGRKTISPDAIDLIRKMSRANPLWGAPRIHGELLKLGLHVAQRSVTKYMVPRAGRPSSHSWKTFLHNHLSSMVSVDFLTVVGGRKPVAAAKTVGRANAGRNSSRLGSKLVVGITAHSKVR
jgi:putative transposase